MLRLYIFKNRKKNLSILLNLTNLVFTALAKVRLGRKNFFFDFYISETYTKIEKKFKIFLA